MNVLVIEDDARIANILRKGLLEDGHQVELSYRGDEGRDLVTSEHFDVVVLDVMLPGVDGFSILKHARTARRAVPILMLTAKDSMMDIVHGLDLGADDYLTKPFQLEVFLARVRAVGRRGHIPQQVQLSVGNLILDRNNRTASRGEEQIELTRKEYVILELLMRRVNQVVTRDQIIQAGWGYDADVRDNTVDFYMHSLRQKINRKEQPSSIRTIRSLGYLLEHSE
ncbi:response regulator transcription factor [Paracidobacterium acidisoli]|uniref:DNA-binding response regulator n=1 Tax=Paracidobacterium acidisoli TaxID=2303751 RepID=A0A372IS25_9BACT|nr:response regulator transcription factor [Paracidobacterium acidisoli]MBT9330616.1 response regulator transcription factor [Paracidobacterium acidisoli]